MPTELLLSKPLDVMPTFLSTVSMVQDDVKAIVARLKGAERPSPAFYAPARDLLIRILSGDMSFSDAKKQALCLPDPTERKCAVGVLEASINFFSSVEVAPLRPLSNLSYRLPNGMDMKVSPIWVRELPVKRVLVLHLWETSLSARQRGAAAATLRIALSRFYPELSGCGLDFISVSVPQFAARRQLQCFDWESATPLGEHELSGFLGLLCQAWDSYRSIGPRPYKRRRDPGLFD